jgi:hypothetical protein
MAAMTVNIASPIGVDGIERFLVRHEVDAESLEFFKGKNELFHASCKPVESPNHDSIEQAAPGISHQSI